MKKRKKKRWILLVVVLLIVLAAIWLMRQTRSGEGLYTEETVTSGAIETYYSFSGNIDVRNRQTISAKTNATVREIYTQEERQIGAGEPLLRLSNGDIIRADMAGEVTDIHVSNGDSISIGAPLVDIVDFDDLQVLFKVDEFDVSAVTVGKKAVVTVDALDMNYEATVEYISKQAQTNAQGVSASASSDVNYYEAKLTAPQDERILPGMKVDVKILNQAEDDALLLPMTALQFDAYNRPYVFVRDTEGAIGEAEIAVGIQDGTMVQITEGLKAGDVVLVPQVSFMLPMMRR